MTSRNILELPWLLKAPADLAAQCRSINPDEPGGASKLRELAGYNLSIRDGTVFSRTLKKLQLKGTDATAFSPLRMALLSFANYDFMHEQLIVGAARHGVSLTVIGTDFGQIEQEAFDPASKTNSSKVDAVLLALDHRWLGLEARVPIDDPQSVVNEVLRRIKMIVSSLRENGGAPTILQTIPQPPASIFGNYDRLQSGTLRAIIAQINIGIVDLVNGGGAYLLDVDALVSEVGSVGWFDRKQWNAYKIPFYFEYAPLYAARLGALLGAIRGKSRKVLILDLDNTIWGGVIGDDGISGIALGQGTARGETFLEIQRAALSLRRRGVVLAVCSKNNEDIARRAFRDHPEMLLKETDITVFQANWNDKVSNIKFIAEKLNLGLDSFVFFDDNPAERGHVRYGLPTVAVPELPEDSMDYPWFMLAPGYFEAVSFSSDDRKRTESYIANTQREQTQAASGSIDDYLASLQMTIQLEPFEAMGRGRITQLINKTNQFNVTTRRYTELEVQSMEGGGVPLTLQVRLQDRFSDLGMIAVVICRNSKDQEKTWELDTFLMSCRVLGRRVEEYVLDTIVKAAFSEGVKRIRGRYIPTPKNALVKDLFPRLGFVMLSSSEAEDLFELDLSSYGDSSQKKPFPFKGI